jgi:DNA-binding NtrC family response regulator
MANILVVDDEVGIRALLSEILTDEGHQVELAEDAASARAARDRARPDLVLLDIWMPDVDGISLLKEWGAAAQLNMPVIMMSGHGTIDTAVEATKYGAIAFLEKPITLQKLLRSVEQSLARPAPRGSEPARGAPAAGPGLRAGGFDGPAMAPTPAPSVNGLDATMTLAPMLASERVFELDRPLREARDAFEKTYFEFHLARENGSMTRVAEKTGLERTHLYRKLKQLGVDLSRNRYRNG